MPPVKRPTRDRPRRDGLPDGEPVELAALADGSLPPEERAALLDRVDASPELAERLAVQQRAVALAGSAAAEVGAPAALRRRIEAERRPRRVPRSPRLVLIGAVAAAAAAVAIGLAISRSGTAGQHFNVALAAPAPAAGRGGDAVLTKTASGWRIELRAPGLPRRDGGRFYEAWLKDAAGVLVPVGTFNDGRRVTLWAGVPPTRFTTLTVTRERADGDQASSGIKVLVGKIQTGR
jgi:hypothetical protein